MINVIEHHHGHKDFKTKRITFNIEGIVSDFHSPSQIAHRHTKHQGQYSVGADYEIFQKYPGFPSQIFLFSVTYFAKFVKKPAKLHGIFFKNML